MSEINKIYIYPTYTPSRDKSGNLYIKYFHEAFEHDKSWKVVNRLWQIGVASILFNLDAEVFIIQWVDLIPNKRLGKLQFLFFLLSIGLLKITNKDIVWLMHNKHAHNGTSRFVDWGMAVMAKASTKVFAHSAEGITYFDNKYPQHKGKCHYIPHPVYDEALKPSLEKQWDYIIWGSISPRKKVAEFLEFAVNEQFFKDKRIMVCGYCNNDEYAERIKVTLTENITFENKFLTDEELENRIERSATILFTYNAESVLSSGALIYSLNFCKPIIGPDVGSFADLKEIVSCYNCFDEIPFIVPKQNDKFIKKYINDNTWEKLPIKIEQLLNK